MNPSNRLRAVCLAAAVLLSGAAHAATTNKSDYEAARSRADTTYKMESDACKSMSGNAKDICKLEAKGHMNVAKAEAEFAYTGKPADKHKLGKARAEATYGVERERCDDMTGNGKDVCIKTAKATRTKALADVRLNKEVAAARSEAGEAKRDADYKVAAEKCESLAGDTKTACMTAAKAQHGKS